MGQQTSSDFSNMVNPPTKVSAALEKFDMDSKSGLGVHMFCFTPRNHATGDTEKIYIASEVTDENDVLDVKYSEWKKTFMAPPRPLGPAGPVGNAPGFTQPESKLKTIWTPTHYFSSGRLAMVAAVALLNQGYSMKECKPENEL
jgi:hypothetical protein